MRRIKIIHFVSKPSFISHQNFLIVMTSCRVQIHCFSKLTLSLVILETCQPLGICVCCHEYLVAERLTVTSRPISVLTLLMDMRWLRSEVCQRFWWRRNSGQMLLRFILKPWCERRPTSCSWWQVHSLIFWWHLQRNQLRNIHRKLERLHISLYHL